MGQRNLTIYTDDRDGKDLEGEPDPVFLAFRDRSWHLTLSDTNLKELERIVDDFTRHAASTQGKGQATKEPSNKYGVPVRTVREWARKGKGRQVVELNGLKIPGQRGRVDARIHELYDKHA